MTTLKLLNFFFHKGELFIFFDHINSNEDDHKDPLINSLPRLWYEVSGHNQIRLIKLAAIYYNWPFSMPRLNANFSPDNLMLRSDFKTKELLLTINIKFTLEYKNPAKNKVVHAKYNVSEFLLLKKNLTELRYKSFNKFIHKMFAKQEANINETYYTKIAVRFTIRNGRDRKKYLHNK